MYDTDLPTAPLALNIPGITYKSIQLKWSRPQPINGIISHYTITCLQANGTIVSLNTTADGLETVSNLRPLTNYTCCISATNEAGEGNQTCVDARTKRGMLTQCEQSYCDIFIFLYMQVLLLNHKKLLQFRPTLTASR